MSLFPLNDLIPHICKELTDAEILRLTCLDRATHAQMLPLTRPTIRVYKIAKAHCTFSVTEVRIMDKPARTDVVMHESHHHCMFVFNGSSYSPVIIVHNVHKLSCWFVYTKNNMTFASINVTYDDMVDGEPSNYVMVSDLIPTLDFINSIIELDTCFSFRCRLRYNLELSCCVDRMLREFETYNGSIQHPLHEPLMDLLAK